MPCWPWTSKYCPIILWPFLAFRCGSVFPWRAPDFSSQPELANGSCSSLFLLSKTLLFFSSVCSLILSCIRSSIMEWDEKGGKPPLTSNVWTSNLRTNLSFSQAILLVPLLLELLSDHKCKAFLSVRNLNVEWLLVIFASRSKLRRLCLELNLFRSNDEWQLPCTQLEHYFPWRNAVRPLSLYSPSIRRPPFIISTRTRLHSRSRFSATREVQEATRGT